MLVVQVVQAVPSIGLLRLREFGSKDDDPASLPAEARCSDYLFSFFLPSFYIRRFPPFEMPWYSRWARETATVRDGGASLRAGDEEN